MSQSTPRSISFHVPEMDCPQELGLIQRSLANLKGIQQVQPDYLKRELRVEYVSEVVSAAQIRQALDQSGFVAQTINEDPLACGGEVCVEGPQDGTAGFPVSHQGDVSPHHWIASLPRELGIATFTWLAALGSAGLSLPHVVTFGLCLATALVAGPSIAAKAWRALRLGRLDMHVLIMLAATGAMLIGEWLEAATVILLFRLSLWIEAGSQRRAEQAIRATLALAPEIAHRLARLGDQPARSNAAEDVPATELASGDIILIRPGERIPADGVIVEGETSLDESPITGESQPVEKGPADSVFAGTLCGEGTLQVRVTEPVGESTLARITRLVDQARSRPAPIERWVDQFARRYTPIVIGVALAVATIPPLIILWRSAPSVTLTNAFAIGEPWLFRGLVLLVIACPCAFVLSTPITIVSGLYRASHLGVLIKGGAYLEQLGQLKTIAFDKTGTLTKGALELVDIVALGAESKDEALRLAASLEQSSEHPLAQAIVRAAEGDVGKCDSFEVLRGYGVAGSIEGKTYVIASPRYFTRRENVSPTTASGAATLPSLTIQHAGTTLAVLAETSGDRVVRWVGAFHLRDTPRDDAKQTMQRLATLGVQQCIMLTGDRAETAQALAREVGVTQFYADLLPEQKIEHIERFAEQDPRLAMVGDGVNDAPALAAAPVGIAMGVTASDLARETADVMLIGPHLERLADLIELSRHVRSTWTQNLVLAFVIKVAVLLLAVFGYAGMWLAVMADVGASLLVIGNGLRLLRVKLA